MTDTAHEGSYRPYRPSNGTEGEIFMAVWCERCALDDPDGDGCKIQARTLAFSIDHPEYPGEWNFTNAGTPQCTAFAVETPPDARCDRTLDMFGRAWDQMPGDAG